MCNDKSNQGGLAGGAGISQERMRSGPFDEYARVQELRSAQFRDHRAQFAIISTLGSGTVRLECHSLADLIDTLAAPRSNAVAVELTIPRPR